jgi:uncharacterized RDD family membrane protein YckC/DNA-binding HxlR family transcriptional regulator
MAVDQESVSRILSVLSHPLRREILITLNERGECSFTDLMNALNVDTGKLSFHIRNLAGLIDQKPSGKYSLNKLGENAVRLVMDLEGWAAEINAGEGKSSIPVASLAKRTWAFLIDFAVVAGVFAAATVMNNVFSLISGASFRLDVNVILFVLVFWVYSTLLEGFGGQSLGKKLMGLVVIRVDGKKMFYDLAAVRNFGKIFIILPFDLLAGHRIRDKRFIRYFDKFAGTTVIDLHP